MARKFYIIGNWKMYKTAREATDYIEELLPLVEEVSAQLGLAVPFTSIAPASRQAQGSPLLIGAQNMNDAREGAFTGEIAGLMIKEAGASFVLLGHSERRHLFGESDALIQRKMQRALQDDLLPILCVGETLKQKEAGERDEVLREQLASALQGIDKEDFLLAYEPVWAIGTGKAATAKMAQEAHAFCRAVLAELLGKRRAGQIAILYGGSVKAENAAELAAQKDIDGLLIGGASLDPKTFAEIALQAIHK